VPKGSILLTKKSIETIDLQNELGKTEFGFWTTVSPGETKTFELTYLLPFKKQNEHSILIQKQPGARDDIKINYKLENGTSWNWQGLLNSDKTIDIDLSK